MKNYQFLIIIIILVLITSCNNQISKDNLPQKVETFDNDIIEPSQPIEEIKTNENLDNIQNDDIQQKPIQELDKETLTYPDNIKQNIIQETNGWIKARKTPTIEFEEDDNFITGYELIYYYKLIQNKKTNYDAWIIFTKVKNQAAYTNRLSIPGENSAYELRVINDNNINYRYSQPINYYVWPIEYNILIEVKCSLDDNTKCENLVSGFIDKYPSLTK